MEVGKAKIRAVAPKKKKIFYKASSSALCPTPNLEDQVSVFMPPVTG
jgi:hypothetical protein